MVTKIISLREAQHVSDSLLVEFCPRGPGSTVFEVDEQRYILSGHAEPALLEYNENRSLATVISVETRQTVTEAFLSAEIEEYKCKDDVFHVRFLQGVVFNFCSSSVQWVASKGISPEAIALLKSLNCEWIGLRVGHGDNFPLAKGLYYVAEEKLFQAYKAYDDVQGAFLQGLLPGPEGQHIPIRTSGHQPGTAVVAVPSRVSGEPTESDPLCGLRVAVKDNFHLKGVRTSLCNRAYRETYPPQDKTAACIRKLELAGAHIIGTLRMAAFAATEEPIECVDYEAPWNPRGDGYQSPAGSSSGSGAAVASYDWLDIAIGSDTSGSGRRPGHWNGCFALRPSHGVLDTDGFVPSFPQFDTPTFLGRNIEHCRRFAAAWYGENLKHTAEDLPFQIIVATDYLPLVKNEAQLQIINNFVAELGYFLKRRPQHMSFNDLWTSQPPAKSQGASLQEYMKDASRDSFFHDDYHSLDQFRADYFRKFSKTPYISPPVRWQWGLSSKITKKERDEAIDRLEIYKEWFSEHVMKLGKARTIVILPVENISPRYRDDATTNFNPVGVPMLFLSPILGGPELVVPSGQIPYQSKVSGREELLPVGISMLAAPGADLELMDTVTKFLKHSGRATEVMTGRTMFVR